MSKRDLSPDSLEAQADALLAAADSMDIPDEIPMPGKSSRPGKAAKAARPEADHIMTDEEAKKAGIVRLDDKQVAALPAASWLMGQEKLRELEEKIMTDLYSLRDEKTGHRVIALALRNKDAVLLGYGGPECGDIIYFVAEGYNGDHGDSLSTALGVEDTSVSPIFVAAGCGFKSGVYTDRIIRQIDVAPTIAALLGVRMPAQCEGSPVYQILDYEF